MNKQLLRIISLFWVIVSLSQIGHSQSQTIEIRENQTSHLIFPSDILYTDIGDNDNFIVGYTNNILRVKGLKNQKRTNLTVITKDDYYYSFYVLYTIQPKLNYFIETSHSVKRLSKKEESNSFSYQLEMPSEKAAPKVIAPISATPSTKNIPSKKATYTTQATHRSMNAQPTKTIDTDYHLEKIRQQAQGLKKKKGQFDYISARHGDILLKVTGIYHSLENCFITYQVRNRGAVPYDISYTEFGIREKRRSKKSASNEQILTPLLLLDEEDSRVGPNTLTTYVVVFDKIAIPQGKQFYMELVEQGRNIFLSIPYNRLPIIRITD